MKIPRVAAIGVVVAVCAASCSTESSEADAWLARFSTKCAEQFSERDCTDLRRQLAENGTWVGKTVDQVLCEHQQREWAYWFNFGDPTDEQIAAFCDPSDPMFGPSGS